MSSAARRGRPTEESAVVTRTLHVRVTEIEHARFQDLSKALGIPPSRLLRRAIREIVNGGPDLFDDGVTAMSETARQLAAVARSLTAELQRPAGAGEGDAARRRTLAEAGEQVAAARDRYAGLVRASRERWVLPKDALPARRRALESD